MLALMRAGYPDRQPLANSARLIMSRQLPTGEWAQEGIEGVFNRNCMVSQLGLESTFCDRPRRLTLYWTNASRPHADFVPIVQAYFHHLGARSIRKEVWGQCIVTQCNFVLMYSAQYEPPIRQKG